MTHDDHNSQRSSAEALVKKDSESSDLFSELFRKTSTSAATSVPSTESVGQAPRESASTLTPSSPLPTVVESVPVPKVPTTLEAAGLSSSLICEMILKQIFLESNILGKVIADRLKLPFFLIEDSLRFLKGERCIEVTSGNDYGPSSYRFSLTDEGRERARGAFDQSRYVGPAPVPLSQYRQQCEAQQVRNIPCTPASLAKAFSGLIIRPFLMDELGPAVCSGSSIFLYGPPGNGKTQIAKGLGRFLNTHGGDIYVPYAVQTEGATITVFDPTLHERAGGPSGGVTELGNDIDSVDVDPRWRRVKRPVVITGGELTLEMLDLRYNASSNFYTAPIHIKANGGVFLIDDFGRQIVSPKDLLNRWIFPLEEGIDYLSLATGKKFPVPFEQLIIFSTNLDPGDLVDEAFLRRIQHKIEIGPPARDLYTEIFKLVCRQRRITYKQAAVDFLYKHFYDQGKQPRSSDPRDLLEIARSICRFRSESVELTEELMAESTRRFFCQLGAV